jgi:hypothetical protein
LLCVFSFTLSPALADEGLGRQAAASPLEALTPGTAFQPILVDEMKWEKVERVVFLSGKMYYDLIKERQERGVEETVGFVRVEVSFLNLFRGSDLRADSLFHLLIDASYSSRQRSSLHSHTTSSAPSSPPFLPPPLPAGSSGHKKNPPTLAPTPSLPLVFNSSSTNTLRVRSLSMREGRLCRRRHQEWGLTSRRVGRRCWRWCLVFNVDAWIRRTSKVFYRASLGA